MYMYVNKRWARSAGNSAIEYLCIIIIYYYYFDDHVSEAEDSRVYLIWGEDDHGEHLKV